MKVWITKYAFTLGIFAEQTKPNHGDSDNMVVIRRAGDTWDQYYHGEGKDWHRSEDAAKARAEAMRIAKIVSLKKSINKMEQLDFS